VEEELKRLLIHGLLHLKGLEHTGATLVAAGAANQETCEMLQLQETILHKLDEEKVF
jgi:probable rRNA maturation factor